VFERPDWRFKSARPLRPAVLGSCLKKSHRIAVANFSLLLKFKEKFFCVLQRQNEAHKGRQYGEVMMHWT
jgi:hypothetical protein